MNILVCDDDIITLEVNYTYISQLSNKFKVTPAIYKFNRIDEKSISTLNNVKFDIAFLDIDINSTKNGIDVAKKILKRNPWSCVIFISSHPEYSIQALDILCFGFLQKPIRAEKLEQLFAKAIISVNNINNSKNSKMLNFKSKRKLFSIRQSTIRYIEKQQQKVVIVTEQDSYEVYDTLKNFEKELDKNFFKIQNGIIVNTDKILMCSTNEVRLKSGEVFTISRARKKDFIEKIRPGV